MTKVMNRRSALGALAAFPALGVPAVAAVVGEAHALSGLIALHRKAWEAFRVATDELEAASPRYHTRFIGVGEREYLLGSGQDEIAKRITAHFEEDAEVLHRIDKLSPGSASPALTALERERDAALARLDAVFAPEAAARERYDEASNAETDSLTAICEYRCGSLDETAQKFRYLKEYEADLLAEQYDAIFDSFLPEGELDDGA